MNCVPKRVQKRVHARPARGYCIQTIADLVLSRKVAGSTALKVRALAACLSPRQRQTLANDFRRASV